MCVKLKSNDYGLNLGAEVLRQCESVKSKQKAFCLLVNSVTWE